MGMTEPALVVPEDGTWLIWGIDVATHRVHAVASAARATTLVAPARVPETLVPALRESWDRMPAGKRLVLLETDLTGAVDTHHAIEHSHDDHSEHGDHEHHAGHEHHDAHGDHDGHEHHEAHGDHGGHEHHEAHGDHGGHEHHGGHEEHDHHGHHGGHDHHAMMAVTGEPSADGLVMEDVEVTVGPVPSVLPTGLVGRFALDGDVVREAELEAVLTEPDALIPDPTTPAAWRAALDVAGGDATSWIPDVELERAASHARFFMTLARLLGWSQLGDAARDLAAALADAPGDRVPETALAAAAKVDKLCRSRRMRSRLGGLAQIGGAEATDLELAGPNARASGLPADARTEHATYAALGFAPTIETDGDAHARALVRAREIVGSLDLVASWAQRPPVAVATPPAVEGPRGPVAVRPMTLGHQAEFRASGHAPALHAAAAATHDLEWPDALTAIASFDLSGWRVG